jgi:polyphosphate glucokinase
MRVLVIDIGGSHIKVLATGRKTPIRIPSGPKMTASTMARDVRKALALFPALLFVVSGPASCLSNT